MAKVKYTSDRDGMWEAMLARKSFTRHEIAGDVKMHKSSVVVYLKSLVAAGYLRETKPEDPFREVTTYTVLKASRLRPLLNREGVTLKQTARQRIWSALKVIGKAPFDWRDVCLVAKTTKNATVGYIHSLRNAGYLRKVAGDSPLTPEKYVMPPSKDSGPLAPVIGKDRREVYDPNLRKVVWRKEVGDVQS
ncbi:MAG: hypothetical protein FJX23_03030 [Alphaproteobacteria bacterium]|nr:hypothetical protein [Alphaproteobacteria bacterium]